MGVMTGLGAFSLLMSIAAPGPLVGAGAAPLALPGAIFGGIFFLVGLINLTPLARRRIRRQLQRQQLLDKMLDEQENRSRQ
jgi:hypothetical protein